MTIARNDGGGGGGVLGAASYWADQARQKFGVVAKMIEGFFEDFDNGGNVRVLNSGTVASLASPAINGSWASFSAGDGTATGTVGYGRATINTLAPLHVVNLKTSTWMMVIRWKTTTTPGATARSGLAFLSASLFAGLLRGKSATFFSVASGATTLLSAIPFDTGTHEMMVRNDGTNIYLSVDGETEVSAANTNVSTGNDELRTDLFAGALEAQQIHQMDYFGLWVVRT